MRDQRRRQERLAEDLEDQALIQRMQARGRCHRGPHKGRIPQAFRHGRLTPKVRVWKRHEEVQGER